jgi:hypothetical protein
MVKIQMRCFLVLLSLLVGVCSGCAGKSAQEQAAQWTPAKQGMTKAQFYKMAAQQMQGHGPANPRPSNAQPAGPPVQGTAGGVH